MDIESICFHMFLHVKEISSKRLGYIYVGGIPLLKLNSCSKTLHHFLDNFMQSLRGVIPLHLHFLVQNLNTVHCFTIETNTLDITHNMIATRSHHHVASRLLNRACFRSPYRLQIRPCRLTEAYSKRSCFASS